MRIRDPFREPEEPFNLVPLTDMVFNLLIFFMAATTFAQVEREMGLKLPRATSFASLSAVPKQLVINVNQAGQAVIARKIYDIDGLNKLLREVKRANPDASVIIRADENGRVGDFARVLDLCKQANFQEAKIGYISGAANTQ